MKNYICNCLPVNASKTKLNLLLSKNYIIGIFAIKGIHHFLQLYSAPPISQVDHAWLEKYQSKTNMVLKKYWVKRNNSFYEQKYSEFVLLKLCSDIL